jgi:predicted CoA-binding protein
MAVDRSEAQRIDDFLAGDSFAVVGASRNRYKYGNKVLRSYQQAGRVVYPVNPNAETVEGLTCYPDVTVLPEPVHGVSIITPPATTERIVPDIIAVGIQHVWMQPGAESSAAVTVLEAAGCSVIWGGACLLVVLGFRNR